MNPIWVIVAAGLYATGLFALASWGDRAARRHVSGNVPEARWTRSAVYALSLAVYCTSWTFFGAVGTAARAGWDYLPIYLGPILMVTLGMPLIRRLVQAGKAQHATSIAGFLSARYGKSQAVASTVTVAATAAALPYIALQLRSLSMSFGALTGKSDGTAAAGLPSGDSGLAVALALAGFAILFGTRQSDMTAGNRGLVLAVAAESAIKLAALVAVAICALWLVGGTAPDRFPPIPFHASPFASVEIDGRFLVMTGMSMLAVLCLPRQFHLMVVEAEEPGPDQPVPGLRTVRWLFPIYLALTALAVPPITLAGLAGLPLTGTPDLFVLTVPLAEGRDLLGLVAFLGGFSAATGMVVVACVALSNMIASDLVAPALLRLNRRAKSNTAAKPLARHLLHARRLAILGLMLLAYLLQMATRAEETLANQGLLAFAAVAQFAPALIGGLIWRRADRLGMLAGLGVGIALWAYTLLLPTYLPLGKTVIPGLFGDPLTNGVVISLGANLAVFWTVSLLARPRLIDKVQAAAVVSRESRPRLPLESGDTTAQVDDIVTLMDRCLGEARTREALDAFALVSGRSYARSAPLDAGLVDFAEGQLARVLGASSARLLITSTLKGRTVPLEDVVALLDETSQKLQFNRDLLQATLEHLSQGVSVVDGDMRLVAWNTSYATLFDLPADLLTVGRPVADIIRYNGEQGRLGPGEVEQQVARRLWHMRAGGPHISERTMPDGRVIRLQGNPMPDGGYVTSFTDVTEDKRKERALEDAKATLEQRVAERTAEAEDARIQAERATQSKTRFLAAASHDVLQPLNAARLFTSALSEETGNANERAARLVSSIDQSIMSADRLLKALLDISKLDSGGLQPNIARVPLDSVLAGLITEFSALADHKGLDFRAVPTGIWVESDRDLLHSVLQNLISNAVRYTRRGKVLVGCRRRGPTVDIQVLDTGPGIPADKQQAIFEEFHQLAETDGGGEKGLGLGLAITRRITTLLGHDLRLVSEPGRGTMFAVSLPRAQAPAPSAAPKRSAGPSGLTGRRVLCLDNDSDVLDGLAALLSRWQAVPLLARDLGEAIARCPDAAAAPDLVLVDFQLDDGAQGPEVYDRLCARWAASPPAAIITAERGADVDAAASARGLAILGKPVPPASLRALLVQLSRTAAE